jgi:phenylpropionate dioxygenase-like ring-hydroxylating dioxygenase large terminal subunit
MSAVPASPNSVTPYAAPALDPMRYQWPAEGPSRAPYWTFTDPLVYAREQERIFRGKVWHYVGLEAEVANPGDFKATQIGESPVLITRGEDGKVYGMLNRCAHRGNLVSMKENGNTKEFYCVYHAWVYNLKGDLTSAAFRRGIRGEGGLPADFKLEEHGLQKLKVETFHGLVFASFALDMEPLADWLGEVGPGIQRVMKGKVRVLGYDTQRIASNWKNYHENPRDSYHAQILHSFYGTFGLSRQSQESGMILASSGRHQYFYTKAGTEKNSADYKETADKLRSSNDGLRLEDPSILHWKDEYGDGVSIQILSVYPSFVLHQIAHSLATRQLIPTGPDSCDLIWTYFGFEDDSPEMAERRLMQTNLVGSAGLVSMEDSAVCGMIRRAIGGADDDASIMQMGGKDLESGGSSKLSERGLRNFWQAYRNDMGF